jgi:rRNA maturation protein Nop10
VANTLPQHKPISLNINSICGHHTASAHPYLPTHPVCGHHTNSDHPNLPTYSVCGHRTNSPQPNLPTQFSLWPPHCLSITQKPYTLIQFMANTLPQHIQISLRKYVCGHHTASAHPNHPTQFRLWPPHCLSTSLSPYPIQFVATTLPQPIPISLHISVCGNHTPSAHRNLPTH